MTEKTTQRVLGIDPGFGRVGWGIIEGGKATWHHVAHGCIETSGGDSFQERLLVIEKELTNIITTYQPGLAGVEELFFAKNIKTAMQVAEARGLILFLLAKHRLPTYEYTPPQIKQAVVGSGSASKVQVEKLVGMTLGLKERVVPDDAADALAIALTTGLSAWREV